MGCSCCPQCSCSVCATGDAAWWGCWEAWITSTAFGVDICAAETPRHCECESQHLIYNLQPPFPSIPGLPCLDQHNENVDPCNLADCSTGPVSSTLSIETMVIGVVTLYRWRYVPGSAGTNSGQYRTALVPLVDFCASTEWDLVSFTGNPGRKCDPGSTPPFGRVVKWPN
jgi:hypothetical protein